MRLLGLMQYIKMFGYSMKNSATNAYNGELNYIRLITDIRKSHLSTVWILDSISLIIWEEHGIQGLPCSSRIISEVTP